MLLELDQNGCKVAADGFFEEYCRPIIMGDLKVFKRAAKWQAFRHR